MRVSTSLDVDDSEVLTALQTAASVRSGETSALDQTEAAIVRIEAGDGAINAVVVRDFDRAREQARAIDAGAISHDAPLLGVPMTVKESFDVAGLPTSWGLAEHAGHVARADAETVRRLKAAGAVILGKTNIARELGDWQSVNPVYGRTRNPRDPRRSAGGSSGGAAAALAAGFVPAELGSDIGNSIRVPAAYCGVWGHKPTHGVVPIAGHFFPTTDAVSDLLGVAGPMACDADDLALLLDVLAHVPLARARRDPAGWRVLLLPEHPAARASTEMRGTVEAVGRALEGAGAAVETGSDLLPDLARMHGDYMRMLLVTIAHGLPMGERVPMSLFEWFALTDVQFRAIRAWDRLFERFDAVIAPVSGTTAFPADDADPAARRLLIDGADTRFADQFAYAGLATFPQLPATSVPVATAADELPIGLQVIGPRFGDHQCIEIARVLHARMRSDA